MASIYSHAAFIISIAITIVYALAAFDDKLVEANCFTNSLKRVCNATSSPNSCYHRFNSMIESNVSQPQVILKNMITSSMDHLSAASQDFAVDGTIERMINNSMKNNGLALSALGSCRELLSLAMDNLNKSLSSQDNTRSLLCAAGVTLQTCVDGCEENARGVEKLVYEKLENVIHLISNCTTFTALIDSCTTTTDLLGRDLSARSRNHYPRWLASEDRKLLQDSMIAADVVVAQDGSGKYKRVSDALKAVPTKSNKRFVIYVKKGIYIEHVKVEMDKWNVMMYGDGMDQTIISGNRSFGGGVDTWNSATFTVQGEGFIARDMRFMNTAGAINQQAVALLSTADRSVFYKCRMDGYQDTLYAHSNSQFYRECHIYGTIDFIFGGASVVIQKSLIFARKPLHGQENAITAHYKKDRQCQTGIVVQSSTILPAQNLDGVSTFLGRPWTEYATCVFVQNTMNKLIDPKGWFPWNNSLGAPPPPDTIFLAEYGNKGDGAGTKNRVNWKGVRVNLSSAEAGKFTVHSLINGDQWLPATQVSYEPGL